MARPKITETAEFKDAVLSAVQAEMGKLAAQLAAAKQSAGAAPQGDDMSFVRQLAMAIGEVSDQGTHRKRVAPEILARRAEAKERMIDLVITAKAEVDKLGNPAEARAKGLVPEYKLINETYLNERLLKPFHLNLVTKRPERVEIYWSGIPNECMRPANKAATPIFKAFMESIGGPTELTASADRRPLWVTAGGLVVKGEPPARRHAVSSLGDPLPSELQVDESNPYSDDLAIKSANDPTAEEVHVLGTVAPPARQNFAGQR